MLAGPMDYTPGGFRNATPSTSGISARTAWRPPAAPR
jgi:hypothetical protein